MHSVRVLLDVVPELLVESGQVRRAAEVWLFRDRSRWHRLVCFFKKD